MRSLALLVQHQALLALQLQQGKPDNFRLTVKFALLDQCIQRPRELVWLVDVDRLPAFLPSHIGPQRLTRHPRPSMTCRNAEPYLPFLS